VSCDAKFAREVRGRDVRDATRRDDRRLGMRAAREFSGWERRLQKPRVLEGSFQSHSVGSVGGISISGCDDESDDDECVYYYAYRD